jgi:hypothetical protein
VLRIARENLSAQRVPSVGVVSAAAFVSAGFAIFLGGVIVDYLSWEWIFFVGAGSAVALLPFRRAAAVAYRRPTYRYNSAAVGSCDQGLLFGISQAKVWGWVDPGTLSLLGACLFILAL